MGAVVAADEVEDSPTAAGATTASSARRPGRGDRARRQPGVAIGVVGRVEAPGRRASGCRSIARRAAGRRSRSDRPASPCRCGGGCDTRPRPAAARRPARSPSRPARPASRPGARVETLRRRGLADRAGAARCGSRAPSARPASGAGVVRAARVGVGEQIALEVGRAAGSRSRISDASRAAAMNAARRAELARLVDLGHLGDRQPFAERHRPRVHVAARELSRRPRRRSASAAEAILAGLELAGAAR